MIIDDEIDFCRLVEKNLEEVGSFEVEVALNGKEGFNLAKLKKPDLILLDILMPGIDGFEVLKMLKQDTGTTKIPVVMLTALEDGESQRRAAELSDEDYIMKPVESRDLTVKIEKILKRTDA